MTWWMAALAVPGVPAAVFAAAWAGLRLVARSAGRKANCPWRDAVEAWTIARYALRDARAERKNAAAELAAETRRLTREQKAAGKPQSSPATTDGDSVHSAVLEEARRAAAAADRTLADKDEQTGRRRDALTTATDDLRKCATDSCKDWRGDVLAKSRGTVRRARRNGFKRFVAFLGKYFESGLRDLKNLKALLTAHYTIASSLVSLVAVLVDIAYYRNFDLDALPLFYVSASLPALAATVLIMAVVTVLSFVGFLLVVAFLFVGGRFVFWLLNLAAASLTWALVTVLSPLPLLVSRSALCARLAAPGPESGAR